MGSFFKYPVRVVSSIVLLILLQAYPAYSQQDIRFKRISVEDGLSQSTVEAIVQDHSGFMWFGTEDGLNRYDGYNFEVFRNDPEDSTSISTSNVWRLYVDRKGFLWIGTYDGGLNRFDPKTETFTRYLHDPSDPHSISNDCVRSIIEDRQGNFWIGTRDGGLNYLDMRTQQFKRFDHNPENTNSLLSNNVRFVYLDKNQNLWIATNRGFSIYNPVSEQFIHFQAGENGSNSLSHNNVRHIFQDHLGIIWISTLGGLDRYDRETGRFINHRHDPTDPGSIGSNSIRNVYEDRQGRVWITTSRGGLNYYDREENSFYSYRFDQANPQSLSNNSPRVVCQDHSGILWIGTFGGGLNNYSPRTHRFFHHRHNPNNSNSLSYPILWSITQGPEGDIWFGADSGELTRYTRNTNRYANYSHILNYPPGSRIELIRKLYWDRSGILWIANHYYGINRYNPANNSCINIGHDPDNPNSLCSNNLRSIYQDRTGDIWFCTFGGGLDHYEQTTQKFTNFHHQPDNPNSLSNNNVISFAQDSDGVYWVATQIGLNRMVFTGESAGPASAKLTDPEITRYYHEPDNPGSLSNSYVLSIHEAQNGDLWFGSMQGLSCVHKQDRAQPVFNRYFMKDGLPNNVVYGILEDSSGNLWLSTNNGLSRFDPRTGSFKNFDIQDGLQGNEFNTGCYTKTNEGTFLFGGVKGAIEFHPDSLTDSSFLAPIVITGFNVFDKPIRLANSITHTEEIVLSHKDNYFSFEFASLDFSKPERNRYAYMLEGLDKDWTNAGNRRFAGYTHVDAGGYVFKVKGTNGDGVWNEAYASIRIIITPPFWKTWWFILLLVLAIGGGIASILTYRVRQLLKFERLRSKIAADLHDDIGAGLTEISIMGEVIAQKLPQSSKQLIVSEIQNIGTTSRNLIDSMSDIVWLVNPRRDSLFDLISRLGDSYKETLTSRDFHFKTQNLESLRNIRLNMEYRQHLLLIFKEAINNSLKYSGGTEILLSVALRGMKLNMKLIDDGNGFDTHQVSTGNGLKNMEDRAERIGGTLTINSTLGKGTVIEFEGNIA